MSNTVYSRLVTTQTAVFVINLVLGTALHQHVNPYSVIKKVEIEVIQDQPPSGKPEK